MAKKSENTLIKKKGDDNGVVGLVGALTAIVSRMGGAFVSNKELEQLDGRIGLRARYENGGIRLWTYDQIEEMKGKLDESKERGSDD